MAGLAHRAALSCHPTGPCQRMRAIPVSTPHLRRLVDLPALIIEVEEFVRGEAHCTAKSMVGNCWITLLYPCSMELNARRVAVTCGNRHGTHPAGLSLSQNHPRGIPNSRVASD